MVIQVKKNDVCEKYIEVHLYNYVNIDNNKDINYNEFRKDTGKAIGENIVITLEQLLNQWIN